MGPVAEKERKAYTRGPAITLPWRMNQDGMGQFVRAWKDCDDGRQFCERHKLSKTQWLKCVAIAAHLRKAGVKLNLMKFRAGPLDGLDIDLLKKIADA